MTDRELQERFRALRDLERAAVPDFEAIAARRPVPRVRWLLPVAAAAAAALVWSVWPAPEPGVPADLDLRWSSATDALLELPGDEWLREMPRLGETPPTPALAPPDRSHLIRRTLS